jgi:hypothetical protein
MKSKQHFINEFYINRIGSSFFIYILFNSSRKVESKIELKFMLATMNQN